MNAVDDATTRLADAAERDQPYRYPRQVDEPGKDTPCDRCRQPLGEHMFRVAHSEWSGNDSVWWLCRACDADLVTWINHKDTSVVFGDT